MSFDSFQPRYILSYAHLSLPILVEFFQRPSTKNYPIRQSRKFNTSTPGRFGFRILVPLFIMEKRTRQLADSSQEYTAYTLGSPRAVSKVAY